MNEPHDHHVIPQFVLRNFAVDEDDSRIPTLMKEGDFAIWKERSIKGIGWEPDFYVHTVGGMPVSIETEINRRIETPVSNSDTWTKIKSGRSDSLDFTDRPILYSLVRHLETRTPHYLRSGEELMEMATDPNSEIPFTAEEREMYSELRANPELRKQMFNLGVLRDFTDGYERSLVAVMRSRLPLRSSTTPVIVAPMEGLSGVDLPLPGQVPYQRQMAVDPFTIVSVVVGDFGGAFVNYEISEQAAQLYNRTVAGQFAKFPAVRHMICGSDRLVEDMIWCRYDLVRDSPLRKIFKRCLEA